MKLTDLNPRWVAVTQWEEADGTQKFWNLGSDLHRREGHGGVSFDCPIHRTHRLAVFFENPTDGLPPQMGQKVRWNRTGDTFETLTLFPSVNAQVGDPACWHGSITNGEVQ